MFRLMLYILNIAWLITNSHQFVQDKPSNLQENVYHGAAAAIPGAYPKRSFYRGFNYPGSIPYYDKDEGPNIPILNYSSDHSGDGVYSFSFTTADGKQVEENGYLKDQYIDNTGQPQGTQVVQGSYSYVSPDGTPVQVAYTADENGFRTSGVQISSNDNTALPLSVHRRRSKNLVDPFYNVNNHYVNHNLLNPYYQYSHGDFNQRRYFGSRYPFNKSEYDFNHPYNHAHNTNNLYHKSWLNQSLKHGYKKQRI